MLYSIIVLLISCKEDEGLLPFEWDICGEINVSDGKRGDLNCSIFFDYDINIGIYGLGLGTLSFLPDRDNEVDVLSLSFDTGSEEIPGNGEMSR